jgi:hypothetical protein
VQQKVNISCGTGMADVGAMALGVLGHQSAGYPGTVGCLNAVVSRFVPALPETLKFSSTIGRYKFSDES